MTSDGWGSDDDAGQSATAVSPLRTLPPPLPTSQHRAGLSDPGWRLGGYGFLHLAGLHAFEIEAHVARAAALRVTVQRLLFHEGHVSPLAYARALGAHEGVDVVARQDDVPPGAFGIDATGLAAEDVREALASARRSGHLPVFYVGTGERSIGPGDRVARLAVEQAVTGLRDRRPAASAGRRMWLWQLVTLAFIAGTLLGTALVAPERLATFLLVTTATLFALIVAFRALVLIAVLVGTFSRGDRSRAAALPDHSLPDATLLVPLYREAAVLPDLVEALSNLDYPVAKLEVAIILEEDDRETRDAAARLAMPPFMRIIVVPDRQPRTKPKALDMALALTRGDLVTVFDAEDVPDRDQLRRAAERIGPMPSRYACAQARLSIYNARQSWLTRQFTLEYAALFHALLPGLVRLGLPIPLSGTSNHFPRRILEAEPWDPFNVTEDADLGIRLARSGGRVGLIDCDTWEEAPYQFRQWLPQRTRWIKGWMQTWLVHTRQPFRTLRDLGLWGSFGFHALIGGFLLSVLTYPIMLTVLMVELLSTTPFDTVPGSLHHIAMTVALTDAGLGVALAVAVLVIGARRGRLGSLAGNIWMAPVYWLLLSIAGWRALVQLIHKPHLWEKTEHHARK